MSRRRRGADRHLLSTDRQSPSRPIVNPVTCRQIAQVQSELEALEATRRANDDKV